MASVIAKIAYRARGLDHRAHGWPADRSKAAAAASKLHKAFVDMFARITDVPIDFVMALLMGSFSKTFASNAVFVATDDEAAKECLKMYFCRQTFSNALSPVQVTVERAGHAIVISAEGAVRRCQRLCSAIA
jgi:hypothetical protein